MKKTALTALALLTLSACTSNGDISLTNPLDSLNYFKEESAKRIAAPVFMLPRTIKANEFNLKSYERVHEKGEPVILYIGRDSHHTGLSSPESRNPVGLRLAAQDAMTNVIYLAQACQYVGDHDDCPSEYMDEKRQSPEVIAAFNTALNNIRGYHNVSGFHVVGYDGGAVIAAVLAAQREDVLSLRTVAGILDTQCYVHSDNPPHSGQSLSAVDIAPQLANTPQHHFIGQIDEQVPPAIYHSFEQAMGESTCTHMTIVPDASHEDRWVEQWKQLRRKPFACETVEELAPVPFEPETLDKIGGPKGYSK